MGKADRASNKAQDLSGRVKEAAGKATDNRDLEVIPEGALRVKCRVGPSGRLLFHCCES